MFTLASLGHTTTPPASCTIGRSACCIPYARCCASMTHLFQHHRYDCNDFTKYSHSALDIQSNIQQHHPHTDTWTLASNHT